MRRRRISPAVFTCGLLAASARPPGCLGRTYVVAPGGRDTDAGSAGAPFGTLQRGVDAAAAGDEFGP